MRKNILISTLCLSTLIYPAASHKKELELHECFRVDTVDVPGAPLHYKMIAVSSVGIDPERDASPPFKCMEGVIGYCVSPDEDLAEELAQTVNVMVHELYTNNHTTKAILDIDWLTLAFQSLKKDVS